MLDSGSSAKPSSANRSRITPETLKILLAIDKYEKLLIILFLFSLPLVNPWVRGDGVGYYAYVRALLIEHRLNFERDWLQANTSFRLGRIDAEGHIAADQYTPTGHLD